MNRRAFIGGGMAAILASRRAPAFCLALRNGMMRPSVPQGWQNPYVTDGLVAMWDGEWNAGGGVHDPNATTWKDIIGGIELDIGENSFGDKCFNATKALGATSSTASIGNVSTVEFAFESNPTSASVFLCLGGSSEHYKLGLYYIKPRDGSSPYVCCNAQAISAHIDLANDRHIAETYDGSSVSMFINGELAETFSGGSRAYNPFSIGGGGGRTASLNGKVFCVRAYSTILSASELASNYAIDNARFNLQ